MRNHWILGILCTATAAVSQVHGVDPDWYPSPKVAVSHTSAILTGAVANNMVVKSDGTTFFFYRRGGSNYWVNTANNGISWSTPSLVTTPAPNAATALSSISADLDQSNNIHMIYKSGNFAISYAKHNGSSWSTPVAVVTNTGGTNDTINFSQVTVDRKGRIHVMWQQGNHKNNMELSSCWYARSVDGGNSFSAAYRISGNNTYDAAFPVADFGGTSSDTLIIPWRENQTAINNTGGWNWDVKAARSTDGGLTWNSPVSLAGGVDDEWDPNLVVDKKGNHHLFYHVYHDNVIPDLNANIYYTFSANGGVAWSTPFLLSENNIRSHLIKTAYDHSNDLVWCAWKDERHFTGINARADLMAVYVKLNGGTPVISQREFLCDHDTVEVAYHNFKVGNDGIIRAIYNNSKAQGKGDTIFYTQRTVPTVGIRKHAQQQELKFYPNPVKDFLHLEGYSGPFCIQDLSGRTVLNIEQGVGTVDLRELSCGLYLLKAEGFTCKLLIAH